MNRQCNLTKRVRIGAVLRYCPVVLSANGRVKPDVVTVNDQEERHPEGSYSLEWYEGKKRIRKSVGNDAAEASRLRLQKEAELNARNNGVAVVADDGPVGRETLAGAIARFLEETKLTKKHGTFRAYDTALRYFMESCRKVFLDEIERRDLLKFSAFLRDEKGHVPRSVHNRFKDVMIFLKAAGVVGLVSKTDWPRFVEEEPEVYEKDELETLFAACDPEEGLWFTFFLQTGCREQEVMHMCWADVNLAQRTVSVRYKQVYGFSPKNYREREIPIPETLVTALTEWKAQSDKTCGLVFPNRNCTPRQDYLDRLKAVVLRAKLDPAKFWLHKFRSTFATFSLWAGVDLRTVQSWLGHSDMESTMRYLKPNRSNETREKVNNIWK